jgi:glutathione S-transferase
MLTLHVYGPYFGLPDGSPFCIKAMTLMKMSGLEYRVEKMSFKQAPKGKAPYLNDNGTIVADSHFIQRHLETKHGVDFSGGHGPAEMATGWALSRMVEEHLYFLTLHLRWLDDENFNKGPRQFFKDIPAPIRPLIANMIRKKQRKTMHLQGLGRHSAEERLALAVGDVKSVEDTLADKPYLFGKAPCGADASVASFLWAASPALFKSEIGEHVRSRLKIMAYIGRMQKQFFPEFPS